MQPPPDPPPTFLALTRMTSSFHADKVSCGGYQTMVLSIDGRVMAWGQVPFSRRS